MALIRKFVLHDNELFVYSDGHIEKMHKQCNRMHIVRQTDCGHGYYRISLTNNAKKQHMVKVHRIMYHAYNPAWDIMNSSLDNSIDHLDRDRTNNNIENLRLVTNQQNCFNRNVKGYCWHKRDKKWQASICINKKAIHLGTFDTELEASTAYQTAKLIHHII